VPAIADRGLEAMIEKERNGMHEDLDWEAKSWLAKLVETDHLRAGYQELAARGLIILDELGERLRQLEDAGETAHKELKALRNHQGRVEALERDQDILLKAYTGLRPEAPRCPGA